MANTTNLHLTEPAEDCLDCHGRLVWMARAQYNDHYECENCGARFYWAKDLDTPTKSWAEIQLDNQKLKIKDAVELLKNLRNTMDELTRRGLDAYPLHVSRQIDDVIECLEVEA